MLWLPKRIRVSRKTLEILHSPSGRIADFAKNITPKFITTEFAGTTFSNDGKTLFVNLQAVGATFAIWGDWDNFNG